MSLLQLFLIILTVIALSVGQILFKIAAGSIDFTFIGFLKCLLNIKLIIALIVYGLATIMWLYVLRTTPLRVAYPFISLAFLVVPILAHLLLKESISWSTFAGAILIGLGVWISVY